MADPEEKMNNFAKERNWPQAPQDQKLKKFEEFPKTGKLCENDRPRVNGTLWRV